MSLKICIGKYCAARPELVLLAIPLIIGLYFLLKKNFINFKTEEEKEQYLVAKKKDKKFLLISRSILILLLLFALASPFTEKSITVPGDISLLILADNSSSFDLFDQTIAPKLANALNERIPVKLQYIASKEKSAIGDGLLNHMSGDDNILIISDGQNNYGRVLGDVILFAASLNSTVSTVEMSPIAADASVQILGPGQVITGEQNSYVVEVTKVGDVPAYNLEVMVDGANIINSKNAEQEAFTRAFSAGYHKIEAHINAADHFPQNNVFYKTIKVIPKPKVLFVSEKISPLLAGLKELYELRLEDHVPDDLSSYHAVILNDIKADGLADKVDELTAFVADGNGLVVIGGQTSYDKGFYQVSSYLIEGLLPVRVGVPETEAKSDVNVVLLIDISGTAGLSFGSLSGSSKLDVQKALALGVIEDMRPEDSIAVVAFNDASHLISPLSRLGDKESDLVTKIRSLQAGGGTLIFQGLRRAQFILEGAEGSKNIIAISDGLDAGSVAALDLTKTLSKQGITVFAMGIGEGTNEAFLKSLVDIGNGLYFEPSEAQNIRILFGEEPKEDEAFNLRILDSNHWITRGDLEITDSISGFNYVVPKSGARTILATAAGNPIITVSNFGLGRVVAVSTDDGSKWAAALLKKQNSKLVTRSINYAIGDPGRNLDFDVSIEDTAINKPGQIKVISDNPPKSDLAFSKIGNNLYTAPFNPIETGFIQILGADVAVNYNDEYLNIGINQELLDLVTLTGGRVFDPEDTDSIVEAVKTYAQRVKIDTVYYRWPFVLAAAILLLLEIVMRRLRENVLSRR